MRNIFCLETEWVQNAHDLKKKSSVQSMLEFFETSSKVDRETDVVHHIFRKVATKSDFEYYLFHLWHDSYANYDTIYLCFHGLPGQIFFADGNKVELKEMAFDANYENIFANKRVHFGCCYTLKENEDLIGEFKKHTGAKTVTGYRNSVDYMQSFIFELWLLEAFRTHCNYAAKRIMTLAEKEMNYYAKHLGFIAY